MSVILTDSTETDTTPMEVYGKILKFQKEIAEPLAAPIEQMQAIGEGTNILPSFKFGEGGSKSRV